MSDWELQSLQIKLATICDISLNWAIRKNTYQHEILRKHAGYEAIMRSPSVAKQDFAFNKILSYFLSYFVYWRCISLLVIPSTHVRQSIYHPDWDRAAATLGSSRTRSNKFHDSHTHRRCLQSCVSKPPPSLSLSHTHIQIKPTGKLWLRLNVQHSISLRYSSPSNSRIRPEAYPAWIHLLERECDHDQGLEHVELFLHGQWTSSWCGS